MLTQKIECFNLDSLYFMDLSFNEQSSGNGCDQFITSGGGFLQTVIYGFAGIDIRDKCLEINVPNIGTSSQWKQLNLIGIDYQYNQMSRRYLCG